MIVSMWMARDLVTVGPRTPVIDATPLMAAKHIRWLPVVEQGHWRRRTGVLRAGRQRAQEAVVSKLRRKFGEAKG